MPQSPQIYAAIKEYRHTALSVDDENTLENIVSSDKGQEEIIDTQKRQKIIMKAVDRLPKKLRQIVILFEFE